MAATHTPGPWQRSGVRIKLGAEDCLQVGPDGFAIAFLPIGKSPNEHAGAIADANLIAAAPDLYDAAEHAMNALIGCCVPAGGVDDRKAMLEAVAMLSAAIVKATTESH